MVGGAAALRVGAVALPKTTPLHAPGEECVRHDLIYRKTFCRKGTNKIAVDAQSLLFKA